MKAPPLPSTRQHMSYDDCLEDKSEDYHNCSVLYCTIRCTLIWAVLIDTCKKWVQILVAKGIRRKRKKERNRASLVATESLQWLQQQKLSCSMYFDHLLQRLNVYQSMRVNINTLLQSLKSVIHNICYLWRYNNLKTFAIYEDITIWRHLLSVKIQQTDWFHGFLAVSVLFCSTVFLFSLYFIYFLVYGAVG